jgi:hypothetical protein
MLYARKDLNYAGSGTINGVLLSHPYQPTRTCHEDKDVWNSPRRVIRIP